MFQALTDPKEISAWQADSVQGRVTEGSTLQLAWPKLGVTLDLEVSELVPERRVVYSHGPARLELNVTNGGVELIHSGPFDDDAAAGTESSWRVALAILATYLGRHTHRPRRVHWATARARGSAALCHAYFTQAELLSSWLGDTDTALGSVGKRVCLTLAGGRTLSGPIIAHTEGRDLALRWREADDSVLVLRTLPVSSDPKQRHVLVGWSRWSELPDAANVTRELDAGVERLRRQLDRMAIA